MKAILKKERSFYKGYDGPKCSYAWFLYRIRKGIDWYEAIKPKPDSLLKDDTGKICCGCKKFKPWSEFYTNRKGACKECIKTRQRSYNSNSTRRYKEEDAILREKKKNDRSYFGTSPLTNSQAFRDAVDNKTEDKNLYQPKYEPTNIDEIIDYEPIVHNEEEFSW